jgi:enoyl-CoA hydratase
MMDYLKYEKDGEIGILKVNRPDALNALSAGLLKELSHFLENTVKDDCLKVLIFTGEGEKAFIAGADIKEMQGMKHTEILDFLELGQNVTHLLESAHFVTLAAVNGYALGGGLEMALACDFIYASKKAKFGLPEVTLGIIPGFGGTQRLARAVGTRTAKEMVVTGKHIAADEAHDLGIVNVLCDPDKLMDECRATAEKIAVHSAIALQQGKNAINFGYQLGIHEALEVERNMFVVCFASKEREEAMNSFLEKHKK